MARLRSRYFINNTSYRRAKEFLQLSRFNCTLAHRAAFSEFWWRKRREDRKKTCFMKPFVMRYVECTCKLLPKSIYLALYLLHNFWIHANAHHEEKLNEKKKKHTHISVSTLHSRACTFPVRTEREKEKEKRNKCMHL